MKPKADAQSMFEQFVGQTGQAADAALLRHSVSLQVTHWYGHLVMCGSEPPKDLPPTSAPPQR